MSSESEDLTKAATRFWSNVDINDDEDECWPWLGLTNRKTGEGIYRVQGQTVPAHLMAYELTFGERGSETDPTVDENGDPQPIVRYCDQPGCVNPLHMVAPVREKPRRVSQAENVVCPIAQCKRRVRIEGLCAPHYRHFLRKLG